MRIEEIMQIEIVPLSQTIQEYCTNNFINSYAEQIKNIRYPEEVDRLILLVDRLLEWYDTAIDEIRNGKYVHNKNAHFKSYDLLKELKSQLVR